MMTMKINLHTHSNTSDGSLSVENLMDTLKKYHYDLVALTDHDTAVGNEIAKKVCKINFIEGIEITSYIPMNLKLYDSSFGLHIVGLGIDSGKMNKEMKKVKNRKQNTFVKILLKKGYSNDEITHLVFKGVLDLNNRISLANFLTSKGHFSSVEEAVSEFSISLYAPSISESIELIHKCDGIAIWAHPYIICKNGDCSINSSEVEQIFKYMVNNEIDGLESYYLQFTDEQQKFLELLAKKYSKMSSTGTDFHADFAWEYKLLEQTTPIDEKMIQYLNDQQKILKKK